MISARNPRSLFCTNQSSVARGFHELFWRWSSLEKSSNKYHAHSFRRNAFPRYIHQHSRKSSSLSDALPSQPSGAIEPTNTPIDTPSETPNKAPKLGKKALEVRQLMRHVPHSVVILSILNLNPRPGESRAAAMTLSSFTTLTLSPKPIITFNIKRPSRTLDALENIHTPNTSSLSIPQKDRYFHIHILECNSSGAQLADRFSRGGPINSEDLELIYPKNHRPSKAIASTLQCQILQDGNGGFLNVGDHTLVFGKVVKVDAAKKTRKKTKEWKGLCYMQGGYHTPIFMKSPNLKKNVSVSVEGNGLGNEAGLKVGIDREPGEDVVLEGEKKNTES